MLNYTYLASKAEIESFGPNDLAKYRYITLFEFGRHADKMQGTEFGLICAGLARFMREDCLVVSSSDLKNASGDSFLKPLFEIFDAPKSMEAYVAIATLYPKTNETTYLNPAYTELVVNPDGIDRYPVYAALNQILGALRSKLTCSSLEDFPIPAHETRPMACPYGTKIKKMRRGFGSVNKVAQQQVPLTNGEGSCQLGRTTLTLAEGNEPITKEKLEQIATFFKISVSSISFERIVPRTDRLKEMRQHLECSKDELAKDFGLATGFFFDMIEAADEVPARTMRFVYSQYKKHLGKKVKWLKFKFTFENLMDVEKTTSLVDRPPSSR